MRGVAGYDLSFFEFFWILALDYYETCKVDVAVIEVGLGGRLDATNILDKSLLSIITSISLDHIQMLGNTVELIAGKHSITSKLKSVASSRQDVRYL